MFNEENIKGKWKEFKGGLQNVWGQLSDDDLERTKGNFGKITSLVQERYGETKETINYKLNRLLASFDNYTDKHPRDIGSTSYERSPVENDRNFSVGNDYDQDQNARH